MKYKNKTTDNRFKEWIRIHLKVLSKIVEPETEDGISHIKTDHFVFVVKPAQREIKPDEWYWQVLGERKKYSNKRLIPVFAFYHLRKKEFVFLVPESLSEMDMDYEMISEKEFIEMGKAIAGTAKRGPGRVVHPEILEAAGLKTVVEKLYGKNWQQILEMAE